MDTTFYPSPVWNSSFDNHDASTTLDDTTLETENDSMIRYDDQRPKILTTRSSPGGPLGKETHHHHHHKLGGYFDDLDSFTSKAFRLDYDDGLSPRELPKLTPNYLHQKASSVDTTTNETVKQSQQSRRNTGFDLDVMHESDEVIQLDPSSPPAMSVSCIQEELD